MIDKKLIPYSGLKKEPFSGSHHGMRYFFQGDDGKSSTTFTVYIYPEPWCFEETPEEEKEKNLFLFPMRAWTMLLHGFGIDLRPKNPNGLTWLKIPCIL